MPVIDHLLASATLRQVLWKLWYPYVTRRLRADDVTFLNYAFADDASPPLALDPADEPNRACIQLYDHVASQGILRGAAVLEISCGHGGGASYLARTRQPSSYTGVDLNAAGIAFCRQRHRVEGLTFHRADALDLPFIPDIFDVVINVEASHCYLSFPAFLAEVNRVLRPGGEFLYADFRFRSGIGLWEDSFAYTSLRPIRKREINAEVLRGMDLNSTRSAELILRHLPKALHGLGRDFAGVKGSRVYSAFQNGAASYRSWHFKKPAAVPMARPSPRASLGF